MRRMYVSLACLAACDPDLCYWEREVVEVENMMGIAATAPPSCFF